MLGAYVSSVLAAGGNPGPARFVFHQRASAPAVALLFALLALPLALAIESGGALARQALQGVLWIALFLFLREAAGSGLGKSGGPVALWLPWGTVGAFLAFTTVRLARAPR
jgi:lipopolysaccharide export LptBFGC system permease protein LptF